MAANALADAQVEDRGVVEGLAAHDENGVRELDIGHGGLDGGVRQCAGQIDRQVSGRTRIDVVRVESLPREPLEQEALLVGGLPADQRADAAAVPGQSAGNLQRALPRDGAQLVALAGQGLDDALVDVHGLVGEAALVAQPAVVDLIVLAGQHAHDLLVAHREGDVALRRAQGADAAGVLDVPGAGAEAVGLRGQRPDRA